MATAKKNNSRNSRAASRKEPKRKLPSTAKIRQLQQIERMQEYSVKVLDIIDVIWRTVNEWDENNFIFRPEKEKYLAGHIGQELIKEAHLLKDERVLCIVPPLLATHDLLMQALISSQIKLETFDDDRAARCMYRYGYRRVYGSCYGPLCQAYGNLRAAANEGRDSELFVERLESDFDSDTGILIAEGFIGADDAAAMGAVIDTKRVKASTDPNRGIEWEPTDTCVELFRLITKSSFTKAQNIRTIETKIRRASSKGVIRRHTKIRPAKYSVVDVVRYALNVRRKEDMAKETEFFEVG